MATGDGETEGKKKGVSIKTIGKVEELLQIR